MTAVFNQVEFMMEEKRKIVISKWYAKSFSIDKIIYTRDEDPEESIVIRSVYPTLVIVFLE